MTVPHDTAARAVNREEANPGWRRLQRARIGGRHHLVFPPGESPTPRTAVVRTSGRQVVVRVRKRVAE